MFTVSNAIMICKKGEFYGKATGGDGGHNQDSSGLERLNLGKTEITDAGLVHLKGLTKLEGLYLRGTKTTPAGIMSFKEALPVCRISR
jgi:hypothetical protein